MHINDKDKLEIKTTMNYEGYEICETDFIGTDLYWKLLKTTLRHQYDIEDKSKTITKRQLIDNGRYVIDKHLGNFDLKVGYTDGDSLKSEVYALFGRKPNPIKYDKIIEYINNQVEQIEVTDIPILYRATEEQSASQKVERIYDNDEVNQAFFKMMPSLTHGIIVNGNSEMTTTMYVHEMAHALIGKHKGNIKNMLNDETLSIYLELIAAKDLDKTGNLLKTAEQLRLFYGKNILLNIEQIIHNDGKLYDLLSNEKYLLSTLHAFALFDTYIKGSNKVKKELDNSLGKIISGKEVLEDVLDHYEATLEKGTKVMRKKIKLYSK